MIALHTGLSGDCLVVLGEGNLNFGTYLDCYSIHPRNIAWKEIQSKATCWATLYCLSVSYSSLVSPTRISTFSPKYFWWRYRLQPGTPPLSWEWTMNSQNINIYLYSVDPLMYINESLGWLCKFVNQFYLRMLIVMSTIPAFNWVLHAENTERLKCPRFITLSTAN